jgi:hypothetical protein
MREQSTQREATGCGVEAEEPGKIVLAANAVEWGERCRIYGRLAQHRRFAHTFAPSVGEHATHFGFQWCLYSSLLLLAHH